MGLVRRAKCLTDRRVLTPAGRRTFEETRPTHIGGVRRLVIDRLPGGTIPALGVAWSAVGEPAPGGTPSPHMV